MASPISTQGLTQGSARHPWITIAIWVLALVLALALISAFLAGALTTKEDFTNNPESKRGDTLLQERLRGPRKAQDIVIVRSETLTVDEPAFREFVEGLFSDLMALRGEVIEEGLHYYLVGDASLISKDRHTTIMPLVMKGEYFDAAKNVHQLRDVLRQANIKGEFQVLLSGEASLSKDWEEIAQKDLQSAEFFGIPAALFILVLVFGTVAAAIIPMMLALASIAVALGAVALLGQVTQLSFFVTNMIAMMGLAVGIDYSLFILSRYREERRQGLEKIEAIGRAGATASRAVLFSGMAVVLALFGLLLLPFTIFRSLSAGAILVVLIAVLASLTLLPAMLSLMGDRVDSWRIPLLRGRRRTFGDDGGGHFWNWLARRIMRRPVISLMVAAGLLIAAVVPYFDIDTGLAGIGSLPDRLQTKQGFLILQKEFPAGLVAQAEVVIDGKISSPSVQAGIERLQAALQVDTIFGPSRLAVNPSGDLALLAVGITGDTTGEEAFSAVSRLRNQYIPQAFSGVQADVLVSGATAFNLDFVNLINSYTPFVFAFVLGLSFILLMVVFHSLVVPVKAILMNLLSVGAAYGLLVLVFQKGVGAGLLGFQQVERVEAWVPLFLFAVLFGLSMDYHVFLLSRIRERFDQSQDNSESVAFGLRSTGRIITGAALIMVVVFGAFASGDMVMFQQMGFGLAVAISLDASIVRSVLVPAAMQLLGRRNWYLPKALHWLPELKMGGRRGE